MTAINYDLVLEEISHELRQAELAALADDVRFEDPHQNWRAPRRTTIEEDVTV